MYTCIFNNVVGFYILLDYLYEYRELLIMFYLLKISSRYIVLSVIYNNKHTKITPSYR